MKQPTKVLVRIRTENAAFDPWERETARILNKLAARIQDGAEPTGANDYNGNRVADVEYVMGETDDEPLAQAGRVIRDLLALSQPISPAELDAIEVRAREVLRRIESEVTL